VNVLSKVRVVVEAAVAAAEAVAVEAVAAVGTVAIVIKNETNYQTQAQTFQNPNQ
jgi:hypothetical protein